MNISEAKKQFKELQGASVDSGKDYSVALVLDRLVNFGINKARDEAIEEAKRLVASVDGAFLTKGEKESIIKVQEGLINSAKVAVSKALQGQITVNDKNSVDILSELYACHKSILSGRVADYEAKCNSYTANFLHLKLDFSHHPCFKGVMRALLAADEGSYGMFISEIGGSI